MDKNISQQRRQFFIKRDFQARYALVFVLAIGIGLNIGVVLTLMAPLLQASIPTYPLIFFVMTFSFIILVAVTSIMFTHKVAGPLYRIEKFLKIISEDHDLSQHVQLRQGDELHEVADEINYTFDKIRESMILDNQKIHLCMNSIDDLIKQVRETIPAGTTNEFLDGLYFARQQLQQTGKKFKLN